MDKINQLKKVIKEQFESNDDSYDIEFSERMVIKFRSIANKEYDIDSKELNYACKIFVNILQGINISPTSSSNVQKLVQINKLVSKLFKNNEFGIPFGSK